MDLSYKIASATLVVTGTIIGGITMNPIVLGTISGAGVILSTFTGTKKYKTKTERCKFAYTTYEKILINLRSYLRGLSFDEGNFVNEIRLIDQIIIDMCPAVSDRFVVQYNKEFN